MKRITLAAMAILVGSGFAIAGDVTVRVTGIVGGPGEIRVAVCTEPEFLKTCRLVTSAPARAGTVTLTLRSVPSGRYAIQAFHDRNGDGELASNLIGLPTEPFGLSRSPAMRFGPPAFADTVVDIDARRTVVPIALRSG